MKHADITLVGKTLSVQIDPTVETPLLRSLKDPDEFDPSLPWSVLNDKAYNSQYGWNPSGFWFPPAGSAVWIEQLFATPGLEVYSTTLPVSFDYAPLFGTDQSDTKWKWQGFMVHNTYAVLHPLLEQYEATYKVFFGNEITGEATPGYQPAEVTFRFKASPLLAADFNADSMVDSEDQKIWQQHFGMTDSVTHLDGDSDLDNDVDGADLLRWQRFHSFSQETLATISIPEPGSFLLLGIAALLLSAGHRARC